MDIKIEELGPCRKKLMVEVPSERVQEEFEKSYGTLSGNVTVPGFRKGHAPRWLLEKRFGETLAAEVKDGLLASSLKDALEKNAISALGTPKFEDVEFQAGQALKFNVTLEVKPTFEIPEYGSVVVERPSVSVTEKDVEASLETYRRAHGKLVREEGPVRRADQYVSADLRLAAEGVDPVEHKGVVISLSAESVMGIGVPKLFKKLEDAHVGDSRTFEAAIPEGYPVERLRGKKGTLHLEVREVQALEAPELDEAFLKTVGFESVESLRERIDQTLRARREREAQEAVEARLEEQLLERLRFDLPEEILKSQTESLVRRRKVELARAGVGQEDIEGRVEELAKISEADAERQVRLFFILDAVAGKEKIEATDADVDARVAAMAAHNRLRPQQMYLWLERQDLMDDLHSDIRTEKTTRFLLERVTLKDEGAQEGGGAAADAT
ncbi:MAG: trigger factor [Planctomycetota bacterium]